MADTKMAKAQAIEEAKACVIKVGGIWYVLRRGDNYKVSSIEHKGWKVAEMIGPGNIQNF